MTDIEIDEEKVCASCRSLYCVSAKLDPDNASILVCGGGGVALEVTRKLKDMGSWVWMLQRSESRRFRSCTMQLTTDMISRICTV